MPSEKSARASERKREQNQPLKTSARTLVAKADQLIAQGAPEAAEAVKKASAALDKTSQKGALSGSSHSPICCFDPEVLTPHHPKRAARRDW